MQNVHIHEKAPQLDLYLKIIPQTCPYLVSNLNRILLNYSNSNMPSLLRIYFSSGFSTPFSYVVSTTLAVTP